MSHSDFFTYNMAFIELIGVIGSSISIYSTYARVPDLMIVENGIEAFLWSGKMLLPILTCVERYLAVVHQSPT
ncbi:hypothetical protein F2P81_018053 [Scophthalmus maximus]|uniref:Uncharacterized protein n=1 Tax=Scophthalmus maximus TaxID=52904 RepID=A0A6A4S9L9_SCOMX|nr:hypothetical protein F2P81_018053 [Scophthalmus maximus]